MKRKQRSQNRAYKKRRRQKKDFKKEIVEGEVKIQAENNNTISQEPRPGAGGGLCTPTAFSS